MIPVAVGLALVGVAAVVSLRRGLGVERELAVAVVRALVQLGAVALIIRAVFDHLGLSAGFVAVMLTAAAVTAGRRIQGVSHPMPRAAAAIALAAAIAAAPLFVVGAFPVTRLVTLPGAFVGMLLGGASPLEAARVQLTVLFALLGAGALAAALATLLIARAVIQPGERIRVPPPRRGHRPSRGSRRWLARRGRYG